MFPLFAVLGHVPTYGSACTQPPHHHTTSQAVYVRGNGGLEIHIKSDSDPFDIAGNEEIDVDAVFKKKYPFNWYNLYIGCGGEFCPYTPPFVLVLFTLHSNHALQAVWIQTPL